MRSGLNLWIRAQKASPSLKDVLMLLMVTSLYPSHWFLHHCWRALIAAILSRSPYCQNTRDF